MEVIFYEGYISTFSNGEFSHFWGDSDEVLVQETMIGK